MKFYKPLLCVWITDVCVCVTTAVGASMGPAHTLHGCVARFFFQVLESKRSHPPSGAVVSVQTLVCRRGRTTSPCSLLIVAEAADITLPIVAFLVLLFVFWWSRVFWRLSGLLRLVFLFLLFRC